MKTDIRKALIVTTAVAATVLIPELASAGPLGQAVDTLAAEVTGPVAKGGTLIAIVIGGLGMAVGEGSKRGMAMLLFGGAIASGALQVYAWIFL